MSGIGTYGDTKAANIAWAKNIPSHWHEYRIKHVFKIVKRIVGELGYEVLSITQKGIKVKDTTSGEGQLAMDYSKYQLAEVGDFAMNHMDLLTGFVDVSKFHGVISPDYRVFKLTHQESDSNYMLYLMQLCYTQKIFFGHGKGVSMLGRWRLPAENFKNFKIPFPPKEEQVQIAKFLNFKLAKLDRLIEKKKQLIALLNEQKAAIINNAVTKGVNPDAEMKESGIEWLGEIPKHWRIARLKYYGKIKSGDGITSEKIQETGNYEVYGGNGFIGFNELFNTIGEKLIIGRVGAKCGNVHYISSKKFISDNALILELDKGYNYNYFFFLLTAANLNRLNTSSAQPLITGKKVMNYHLPIAPEDEQLQIVSFIENESNKINLTISKIEKEISLTEEYRIALISEAVTGKIDVRNYKIPEYKSANELATELSIAAESEPEYNGLN